MNLIISVKVVPSSGKNKWVLDKAGMLKCYLKSPPEKELANKELIKLFSKVLRIPQEKVKIISGQTARTKKISLTIALDYNQLLDRLGIQEHNQKKIG